MTIRRIRFTSREAAERHPHAADSAVISITDPGSPPAKLDAAFAHVLRVSFWDAVPADPFQPPLPGQFTHEHAQRVAAFVLARHREARSYDLLVHCEQGVSRSAAVALFAEAATGAELIARPYTHQANPYVVEMLQRFSPRPILIPSEPPPERRRGERHWSTTQTALGISWG